MTFRSRSLALVSLWIVACQPGACGREPAGRPRRAAQIDTHETAPPVDVPPTLPPPIPAPNDVAAPPANAVRARSGLASLVLARGTGSEHPRPWDEVRVHYTGWTTDGRMFDSSVTHGEPSDLALDRVIPGFREGVSEMVVGERRRLWIPAELAYAGRPGRPPGMLVFEIELLGIRRLERPVAAPADVGAAPDDAECLPSGLCSRVLRPGRGTAHPSPTSRVALEFSAWTADGRALDSTRARGEPAHLVIGGLMPGLREGLALMTEGERRRLWIPASLAGGEQAHGGAGPVVYEVELLTIESP